jgi:sugar O-acyltransferase (sialic acid O-acetyltransferase NeuD family)
MKRLWILGAGGFGREVYDWASDIRRVRPEWDIAGFLDDDLDALRDRPCDLPLVGPIEGHEFTADDLAVIAIANTRVRESIATNLASRVQFVSLIHPTVIVGSHSPIGTGAILCPRVTVTTNSRLGDHVHLNLHTTIGHDATLEAFCTLSDHVDICGNVHVERGAFFGSHASATPSVRIGAFARIGAGSVVIKDVPGEVTMVGVPARPICVAPAK